MNAAFAINDASYSATCYFMVFIPNGITADQSTWKEWLAAQYAAGTPVTVVYELAAPTTEAIDPITIPALDGANTVYMDAGGTVEASGSVIRETDPTVPAWAKEPQPPVYTAEDVGALPVGTTASDVGAVPAGRTVNGKALSTDVVLGAGDVGAVSVARTVNGKALATDVVLAAVDVGAVPVDRKINGKSLSSDVTLTPSDIGAVALVDGKASAEAISAGVVQVAASRALQLSDAGRLLEVAAAGAVVITVPTDAAAAFAVGTEIEILQEGAGGVTVEAAEGVTLHSLDEAREIAGQYGVVALKKRAANDWRMMGALQ